MTATQTMQQTITRQLQRLRYPTQRSRLYAWQRGIKIPDEGGKIRNELEAYLHPEARLAAMVNGEPNPDQVRRELMQFWQSQGDDYLQRVAREARRYARRAARQHLYSDAEAATRLRFRLNVLQDSFTDRLKQEKRRSDLWAHLIPDIGTRETDNR